MLVLYHSPLDAGSRAVRLALAEYSIAFDLAEERTWERRTEFLHLNPAGRVPVLVEDGQAVSGAGAILEYLDETRGADLGSRRLMPAGAMERAEVRRLIDWFLVKMAHEVTDLLVHEKIEKRFMRNGGGPDMSAVRAARANIRYHLKYVGFLMGRRSFIAGEWLTFADLAAAAAVSAVDYLGDVPWAEDETAKTWYARMKSRPSFRALLADQIPGMPPPEHYADLDF